MCVAQRRKELEDGSGDEEGITKDVEKASLEDDDDDKGHVEISTSTLRKLIQGKKKAIGANKPTARVVPQAPEVESDEEDHTPLSSSRHVSPTVCMCCLSLNVILCIWPVV